MKLLAPVPTAGRHRAGLPGNVDIISRVGFPPRGIFSRLTREIKEWNVIGHRRKATLALEDGTTYEGWSFGVPGD